jgi:CubicO group peptidase (beta-lactamase class C family)
MNPRCAGWLVHAPVLLGLFVVASPARAQRQPIDEWVQSYMRERQVPGLALGILQGGRIVKVEGYGLANVEQGAPVTPATVFESASLGKQFTAAAILLLLQDGKLSLDDPVTKYLPAAPNAWRGITIRHLLTHTSGIPDYEGRDSTLNLRLDYTEQELLQRFAGYALLFDPGQDWSYSSSGYVLLGIIIRTVTGEHWGELLRKRVFEPVGMNTARVISYDDIVPNRAAGYRLVEGRLKNREVVGPGWNTTADGSLLLTLLDLAKWDAALYGNALLSDSAKRLMWSPVRLSDGTLASYGLGWHLTDAPRRRAVEHAGDGWGFRTYMGRFLDDSLTVIVLANSSAVDPTEVGHRVAALYRPALAPPARSVIRLAPAKLDEYVGDYRLPTGELLRVIRTEGGLSVEGDIGLGPIVPEAPDLFFNPGWWEAQVAFARNERGDVTWLRLRRYPSSPARARRVR